MLELQCLLALPALQSLTVSASKLRQSAGGGLHALRWAYNLKL